MNWLKKKLSKACNEGYADFTASGHGKIYDTQVAEFVMKHLKPWDWLNPYKVTTAVLWAFTCLQEFDSDPEEVWKEMEW